jgi:hypothetical protein
LFWADLQVTVQPNRASVPAHQRSDGLNDHLTGNAAGMAWHYMRWNRIEESTNADRSRGQLTRLIDIAGTHISIET